MKIDSHILQGIDLEIVSCQKNTKPLKETEGIIIHYTAGSSANSSVRHLSNPLVKASAHVVISPSGHIYQLVPFNTEAWHAGKSNYMGRSNLNHYTIGIELANYGALKKEDDKYLTWFNKEVPREFVNVIDIKGSTTYWHSYSFLQLKRAYDLCRLLIDRYPIKYIAGHSEISPRKQDPGPAFPMRTFTKLLRGRIIHK